MSASKPKNWLDALLPLPRPEYAKQTEALLTDLLWRSEGSSLGERDLIGDLVKLEPAAGNSQLEPGRLVPRLRHGGSPRLMATFPLAESMDTSTLVASSSMATPTRALLESVLAPRSRGDKTEACVPVHPSLVSLQTLHGLVNKENPANLATAIETMGWLGGAPALGHAAAALLEAFSVPTTMRDGATGVLENWPAAIAAHVWNALPRTPHWQAGAKWQPWPGVSAVRLGVVGAAPLSDYPRTPFTWFWQRWKRLTDPAKGWHNVLPARRFVDWTMCLLRSGLAFSYLWEAEFYTRLHERISGRLSPGAATTDRVRSMLTDGAVLAVFEPPRIPASQKAIWRATSDLLARGHVARERYLNFLGNDAQRPTGATIADSLDTWLQGLSATDVQQLGAPLEVGSRTANNQKEFVRYLVRERSSDDDSIDQSDFYYLARTKGRHTWFHPGPEWLVVVASLLCDAPGGECTLGELQEDLASLGVRVDRSVLIGLLEESGLSTDSPDADSALVIRSGF